MSSDFFESFDSGIGALTNRWGSGIDTSIPGQVTVSGVSGIMERPWGAAAGHGYGTYTIVAKLDGNVQGSAGLLWPGDDVWPGPEMDLIEIVGGIPYGTLHWQGGNGRDAYASQYYDGIDESRVHTYSLDWEPGSVTFYVDGRSWGSFTDHVARDYDHGGVNMTISIMNTNPNTAITVYEVSYHASGGAGVAAETVEQGSAGTEAASLDRSEPPTGTEDATRFSLDAETPAAADQTSADGAETATVAPASGEDTAAPQDTINDSIDADASNWSAPSWSWQGRHGAWSWHGTDAVWA
ncbi:family 16 glycosylhydrolase [Paracraurococcus lichenis]|uniref:Family 16 glycosylhydrolase n=1 Tax=Paracraurococcus lichenis TaxID=3064888 RepID=A0ABT9E3K9_9PROT|nr:family 16 glycosylhydrolase [Paracraurococcus sp. LOR1-02]MDO9710747.1 family 16 glycosylhydrolase [Paracraurococcus sp. LOR1-02]